MNTPITIELSITVGTTSAHLSIKSTNPQEIVDVLNELAAKTKSL